MTNNDKAAPAAPARGMQDRHGLWDAPELRWHRTVATAFALLFAIYAIWSCWFNYVDPKGGDFLSFWAAGRLVLEGTPALAYDIAAHRQMEAQVLLPEGPLPFPYPPPFLFIVAPFGFTPFWAAFAAWIFTGGALFILACRKIAPLPFSWGQPAVFVNAVSGQNGFLSSAVFLFGTSLLKRRPFAAGMILGCLLMKPQLALLLPVAMLAAREWRAIAGGVLAAVLLVASALLVFGPSAYAGFLNILPFYSGALETERWAWNELASTFAALRHIGVPQAPAFLIHAVVAAAAAVTTARAWYLGLETRVATLAAATLLIPPYLFTYDTLLMVVPLGWLLAQHRLRLSALVWLLCFLPILTYWGFYPGPNTVPIAAVMCLFVLNRPAQSAGRRRDDGGLPQDHSHRPGPRPAIDQAAS